MIGQPAQPDQLAFTGTTGVSGKVAAGITFIAVGFLITLLHLTLTRANRDREH